MTVTAEAVEVDTETGEENGADEVETESKGKRGRTRDFTKSNAHYDELTGFINSHEDWVKAGLPEVSPLQVKAILALKTEHANTPEVIAAREQRKAEREAENAQYAGMTDEQIKAAKAAKRAEAQYEKLQKKAQEAMEKANALKAAATGSAEDLQAVVESDQEEAEEPKKRGLRRNR